MKKYTRFAVVLSVTSCVAIAVAGCASSPASRTSKRLSANEIIDTLKESYPNGVAPDVARRRMEENGFECTRIRNGTFVHKIHHNGGTTENRKHENIDFIHCDRKTQDGIWVTYFDEVALVIENHAVVDVLSNWAAVGP